MILNCTAVGPKQPQVSVVNNVIVGIRTFHTPTRFSPLSRFLNHLTLTDVEVEGVSFRDD